MQLFYAPGLTSEKIYILPDEESMHCIAVLRYKEGQEITMTDGEGHFIRSVINKIHKKQVIVDIIEKIPVARTHNYHLRIAIAPTKSIDRFEWFIEKATEIGVDNITPIITDNSERKVIRIDRLQKIIIAAMKQSLKAYLPKIDEPILFSRFLKDVSDDQLLIAHCYDHNRIPLQQAYKAGNNATILIGPEGDFSNNELEMASNKGFIGVSLGESRLRTETAGIVACHSIFFMNA